MGRLAAVAVQEAGVRRREGLHSAHSTQGLLPCSALLWGGQPAKPSRQAGSSGQKQQLWEDK